jgi:hypothetical protein
MIPSLYRVSEFAPKEYQQFLSYMTGWLSVSKRLQDQRGDY